MKQLILSFFLLSVAYFVNGQISGSLMQHPDVSETQIAFIYGDDLWIVDKKGGKASKLSSPDGNESNPRFSPDGQTIAFTANYQGNNDVYIISVNGGVPKRLTYHGMNDRVLGWTPDGQAVLFASSRESGRQRFNQLYTIPIAGGPPTKLPVPYGEYASLSADGKQIAFTDRSRVYRNWKRYRGGTAPDIHLFNLATYETTNITNNTANDELPMWIGNTIYYMSDNGPNKRNNLWKYDVTTKEHSQLTTFKDYDMTFPESGPNEIIFEVGGKLYIYNISTNKSTEVKIELISDEKGLIPQHKKVVSYIQNATIAPDGKRVIVEARGDLFNLPAKEGYVSNLTASSGSAERYPAWSPDGGSLAYWSDESGEYQLVIQDMENPEKTKTLSDFNSGFNYNIYWSPDSKKLVYVDQAMRINCVDVATGEIVEADKGKYMFEGGLRNFSVSWSPDSQWFAYSHGTNNRLKSAIFVYNTETNEGTQLTSGYYSDNSPVFSPDGKYIFYTTSRSFQPVYSNLDNTFIYPNTMQIAVGTLQDSTSSLLDVKNDDFKIKKSKEDKKDSEKSDKDKKEKENEEEEEASADSTESEDKTIIDIDGFEQRVELLDIPAGNITNLYALKGKLIFTRYPNSGSTPGSDASIEFYSFDKREVKTIISGYANYQVAADGEKMLLTRGRTLAVVDIASDQKAEDKVPVDNMVMEVIPKEEWKQIFMDVWRFERDFFYDPEMHGVDWDLMKKRYGALIDQANSRSDVNLIIGDLIAELNASHTYAGGGDIQRAATINVGYLGADFIIENGKYKISKIIAGAPWDVEARSPLSKPGIDVQEGDYLLAINGRSMDISKPISGALQGLADEAVQLTISKNGSMDEAKTVVVKTLSSETRLRHLAWIEHNRQMVDKASNGKIGYVYVRSTGVDGQNELFRQYYAQLDKEAMIIDERFNSGGQIPDRFIELLEREPLAYWAVRDGEDWSWPMASNFGPKVMLINGFSGSGGDAFPDYFKKRGIGPVIGTRTWGGLIGITGAPSLVDNGGITMPTFRMYDPNGEWFREGHGVDPDIEVVEDFEVLAKGSDAQLEAGIKEAMRLLEQNKGAKKPPRPKYEKRN